MGSISEKVGKIKPIGFFVAMATTFGLFFLIATPPLQTPDETVHFLRAYQVSGFNLAVDQSAGKVGGELPRSLGETIDLTTTNPDISFAANKKYEGQKTIKAFSIKEDENDRVFYDFSTTSLYSPVSYIPQAIGIGLGRILRVAPIAMIYMGRLVNLSVWIGLMVLAIHLIPRKKWLITFLGLLPMALSQAASLSSDVMAVGLVAFFLAYILSIAASKNKLTTKQIAAVLLLAVTLTLSKQVMFVFLPLVLLIPSDKFKSRTTAVVCKAGMIVLPCLVLMGWMLLNQGIDISASFTNHQVPTDQIKFIIKNPHSYINSLWNTFFYTWGDGVTRSFIGAFGWLDAPLGESITVIGYIGLAALYFMNDEKYSNWLDRNQKIILGGTAILYWLAVNTALYVYYTPVGFKIIYGLQGRYFIPVALLLIPILYSNFIMAKKGVYQNIAVYLPVFLLIASSITLYVRFYINNV